MEGFGESENEWKSGGQKKFIMLLSLRYKGYSNEKEDRKKHISEDRRVGNNKENQLKKDETNGLGE